MRQEVSDGPEGKPQDEAGRAKAPGGTPGVGQEAGDQQAKQWTQQGRHQAVDFHGLPDHGVLGHDSADEADGEALVGAVNSKGQKNDHGHGSGQEADNRPIPPESGIGRHMPVPEQAGDGRQGNEQDEKRNAEIHVVGHAGTDGGDQAAGGRRIGGHFGQGAPGTHHGAGQLAVEQGTDRDGGCAQYEAGQQRQQDRADCAGPAARVGISPSERQQGEKRRGQEREKGDMQITGIGAEQGKSRQNAAPDGPVPDGAIEAVKQPGGKAMAKPVGDPVKSVIHA